jgi:uncharacterized protein YlxW (UPF0749 family)
MSYHDELDKWDAASSDFDLKKMADNATIRHRRVGALNTEGQSPEQNAIENIRYDVLGYKEIADILVKAVNFLEYTHYRTYGDEDSDRDSKTKLLEKLESFRADMEKLQSSIKHFMYETRNNTTNNTAELMKQKKRRN